MRQLDGKVALVTGAAQGIGKACAKAMAASGAKILIADINVPGAEATAAEIVADGGTAHAVEADVAQEEAVCAMIDAAVHRWGRLDTLVNNAHSGQIADTDIVATSRETWDKVFAGTLFGVVYGCKYAVPAMLRTGGGSIINVASNAVLGGDYARVAYAAAKSGVVSITKYTATAFGRDGIRCNSLSPGVLVTATMMEKFPARMREIVMDYVLAPRMGAPEDAAGLAVFLASDASSFINGQIISVDGGLNTQLNVITELRRNNIFAHEPKRDG